MADDKVTKNEETRAFKSEGGSLKDASNREKLYLGIIAVLVVLCGFLTWQFFANRTTVENIALYNQNLQEDKKALNNELDEMLAQYDELETDNQELQSEIIQQKDRIEELQEEIEKNKGNVALIRKYKKEVTTLRTIMKGYVVTIDSLNTLNQNLMTENTTIKRELSSSQQKNQQLSSQKENLEGIVRKASVLDTKNFTFEGIRIRNSGKQTDTRNAQRIELFKVCCTLEENITTKPGEKILYVKVFDPSGKIVAPEENPSDPNAPGTFSSKRAINYANREMDVCVYVNLNGVELPEGDYTVKMYEAGAEIGQANANFR